MDTSLLLTEPELRPFLPLLYVAWADGDFSSEERALIAERIEGQPWLTPTLRAALHPWLEPGSPPSAEALARLGQTLTTAAATLSPEARSSLGALARGMAKLSPDATSEALTQVDELLALLQPDPALLPVPRDHPEDVSLWGPPRFDQPALQALLDGRFAADRERVRQFLSLPEHRAAFGLSPQAYREQVFTWLKALAEQGFGRLAYPGVTCDAPDLGPFLATMETLALGDLSLWVKFGVQFGLWGGSIFFLGTEAQQRTWLPKVASLEAPGCFAMSEVGHGSNVADLETVARYDPATAQLVLHSPRESARKDWAGNAALHGRFATVFAQLEVDGARHGVHAVVVPIRDAQGQPEEGIRIGDSGHKLGLNGVDNGRLWFDQVRVPRSALLGRYATITADHRYQSTIESPSRRFFTMLGTLVGGRISVAAASLSAAKVGLAVAVRYAAARRQFGPQDQPETLLLRYPTHQRRLFPALASTYAFHFAVDALREAFLALPRDADSRELEARAAGLKAGASWHATSTLQLCREACGGQGYLSVNRIPDLRKDADIFTTFEGDNTVLLQLLAKSLLTGFRQQFTSGGAVKVVRYLAGQAVTALREKNPFTTRGTDPQTLRSADYQLAALRFREQSLLSSAVRRVRKRLGNKQDPAQALNEVQEHLVALALANVDRVVLEAFVQAETQAPEALKETLGRLRALHGLCRIETHLGWLQANDYVESSRAKAVRDQVPLLFEELLPDAVPLVDAFGIPPVCLGAPIAFHDPAYPR